MNFDIFQELKAIKEDKLSFDGATNDLTKAFDVKYQQFKKTIDYNFSDGKKAALTFTSHAKEQCMNRVADKMNPMQFTDFLKKIMDGMYAQFDTINQYYYDQSVNKFMVFSKSHRLGLIIKYGRVRSMTTLFGVIVITVLPFYKTNGNIDTVKVFTESMNDSMKFITVD